MSTSNSNCSGHRYPRHLHAIVRLFSHASLCIATYYVALDRIAKELLAGGDNRAGQEDGGGDLVEAFERPVVNGNLVHLKE